MIMHDTYNTLGIARAISPTRQTNSDSAVVSQIIDLQEYKSAEFVIALGDAASVLDGYNSVVGELVEGADVLSKAESSLNRHGSLDHSIKIDECGTR